VSTPAPPSRRPITHVAVGVVVRHDGALLMADRPAGKPYPGYWEFPGGKIEPGESVHAALARELFEELGIRVARSWPWVVLDHEYPHAHVRLHFRRVPDWEGEPHPHEGQRLLFLAPGDDPPQPLLPAAVPALRWARLPTCIGLAAQQDEALARVTAALERGLRVLAAPPPAAGDAATEERWAQALEFARARRALLLAIEAGDALAGGNARPGFETDGWLLSVPALRACAARPAGACVGAFARAAADLALAAALGLDFCIAAPDQAQSFLPGSALRTLARCTPLPLYFPLQPSPAALRDAWSAGAAGLAVPW
jgi:8-oxo-dGTP diphosphatase